MKSFIEWLNEGKNTHQLHIEQLSFGGVKELRRAIDILRDLRDQMYRSNSSKKENNVSQKWDGAPAVFFGINPENGKFFVSGKAIFKSNPRLMYSVEDVENDRWYGNMPELKDKLINAFNYLKPTVTKGIYQGDLMFTPGDLKMDTIDGKKFVTFKPNTITYAIHDGTDLAKRIKSSKIGIVVHTRYDGSKIEDLSANFNIDINDLKRNDNVWMVDAYLPSYSGILSFTKEEYDQINTMLSQIGKYFQSVSKQAFESLNGTFLGQKLETTVNQFIRGGSMVGDVRTYFARFEEHIEPAMEREISKFKTEKKQQEVKDKYEKLMSDYDKYKKEIAIIIEIYKLISQAKMMFVSKFEEIEGDVKTFIQTSDGFQHSKPEGFCAVSPDGSEITKLVNRLEFSKNNFNIAKTWK